MKIPSFFFILHATIDRSIQRPALLHCRVTSHNPKMTPPELLMSLLESSLTLESLILRFHIVVKYHTLSHHWATVKVEVSAGILDGATGAVILDYII